MTRALPKALVVLVVAALLLCSVTVVGTIFYQASVTEQISQLEANLAAVQGRLRKQQAEYDEYVAALPQVEYDLAVIAPQAEEISAREQELRDQRKALRAENSALAEELNLLLSQADAAAQEAANVADAVQQLQDALDALQEIQQFIQ